MLAVYRASTALLAGHAAAAQAVFSLFGILGIATLLPGLVIRSQGGSLNSLGMTRRRLGVSLSISAFFAIGSLPAYFASAPGTSALPHLADGLLNLWEPLFVFGWLQLRFEDAFGWLPAPLIASACFAAYHLGSLPADALGPLAAWGAVVGVLFAFTRNLFVVFPLAWGVATAIGAPAGSSGGWTQVALAAGLILVQVAVLRALVPSHESPDKRFQQKVPPSAVYSDGD